MVDTSYWRVFVKSHGAGESDLRLRTPLIGEDDAEIPHRIPFNGPLNISSWCHHEGAAPTPGAGVFLGFSRYSVDPETWRTVYATLEPYGEGESDWVVGQGEKLVCKSWAVPFTGCARDHIEMLGDGTPIYFGDIFLIRRWSMMSQVAVKARVKAIIQRHEGNKRSESRANQAHIDALRLVNGLEPL
ncbi:hypothetical protein PVAG01_07554 [Phlyctema vagabunda]|uniref:Uncharacterized protein n=1 Tax=Phlyctema vagabunda TaxID=108571 RepID=A0ABR4PCW2_9HELO